MKIKLHLLTLTAAFALTAAKAQFTSVTDCGANGIGHSVFFINPDTGFVAGEDIGKGVIQRTMNGGNTWTRVYITSTSLEWVEDICFLNDSTGIAVGVNGTILRSTDMGTTWGSPQFIPGVDAFNSVFFPTPTLGYAVGVGAGGSQGKIYKTTDGGMNWAPQVSNADSALRTVFFLDADTGYAAGNYDIVKTTDGGTTWTAASTNSDPMGSEEHLEMFCTDANTCFLPFLGMQKTTNGGSSWSPVSLPASAPFVYYITSIYFTDALTGFAAGAKLDTTNFSYTGSILKTSDGGQTWVNINTAANDIALAQASLSSIRFVDPQTGYTTGLGGKTLKTANAGGSTTGIADAHQKTGEISVYPNPSAGNFTVTLPKTKGQLQLINSIGQVIETRIIDGQVDATFRLMNGGIYFVRFVNDTQTGIKKIMVSE